MKKFTFFNGLKFYSQSKVNPLNLTWEQVNGYTTY